jgi:conserved repeat domain
VLHSNHPNTTRKNVSGYQRKTWRNYVCTEIQNGICDPRLVDGGNFIHCVGSNNSHRNVTTKAATGHRTFCISGTVAQGAIGSATKYGLLSIRLPIAFQDELPGESTPTIPLTKTATETPTPEPSLEAAVTATDTPEETPVVEETPTPSPTFESTPTPSGTPISAQTSTLSTESPALSVEFSATPDQVKVTDQVTFTVKIVNRGSFPATGLRFTNILPEGFNFIPGKNKNFTFDSRTRELRWLADQGTNLPGGESLILEYAIAVIASRADVAQIIDTASVGADALTEPLVIETTLLLTRSETSLTMLNADRREANGLNGKVKLKFPESAWKAQQAVSIQDLSKDFSGNEDGESWLIFELDLRAPKTNDIQTAFAVSTGVISEDILEPSSQETATPAPPPTGEPASPENDQIIPWNPLRQNSSSL